MNAHRYTATTMEAALAKVKSDLGRDAVILHTRCYRKGGVLGIGAREMVEVTASNDVRVTPRSRPSAAAAVAVAPATPLEKVYKRAGASDDLGSIRSEIAGVRTMIEDLVKQTRPSRTTHWPDPLRNWYARLTREGLSEACALELLEPLSARFAEAGRVEPAAVATMVTARIAQAVRTAAPIAAGRPGAPTIVALVGPTGVGKTTTIAKLAAHFALRERKGVGLLTLDTYRIAAIEQLRTYARIIDVPLEVALSPAELPDALARLRNASIIFIDTAGRSQRDSMKINDLKGFFEKKRPTQMHLVLSATAERSAIADTIDKFSIYNPDRILITKLDEMPSYGKLLDISSLAPLPVSYVTTGQDVPDDIQAAVPERIAALVAGEVGLDR
jgi:flagellar biosynthesis protein FlhF